MNLDNISKSICKKILIAIATIVCLNVIDKAANTHDPSKTRVDDDGNVYLGTDDYTVV